MIQGKRKRINYKVRKVIEKPQEQWNIKHNAVVTPMPLLCYDNVQRLLEQDIRVAPGRKMCTFLPAWSIVLTVDEA